MSTSSNVHLLTGYASYLLEKEINKGMEPGKGPFVAAFGSTNLGDVSPNTQGAKVILFTRRLDALNLSSALIPGSPATR